jgi:hypothetical protein
MLLVAIDLDGFPFTWSASPPRAPQFRTLAPRPILHRLPPIEPSYLIAENST